MGVIYAYVMVGPFSTLGNFPMLHFAKSSLSSLQSSQPHIALAEAPLLKLPPNIVYLRAPAEHRGAFEQGSALAHATPRSPAPAFGAPPGHRRTRHSTGRGTDHRREHDASRLARWDEASRTDWKRPWTVELLFLGVWLWSSFPVLIQLLLDVLTC